MRRHRKSAAATAVLLGFSLVAAACGDDDEASDTGGGTTATTTGATSGDTTATTAGDTTATTTAETGGTTAPTTGGGGGGECAATGGSDSGSTDTTGATVTTAASTDTTASGFKRPASAQAGGEFIDLGTFVGDPPEHLDPALNSTLDAYQVINAMYDGLTDLDESDPAGTQIVPLVADEYSANEDATVWTFHIREGAQFADGEEINASTFLRSWERASDPDFAGDYSYLFNFIKCGAEKLAGEVPDLGDGVVADDATRTLTVTLSAPYSNFDAVAGFQLFFPMPEASMENPGDYENGVMIGNGPYTLEEPRTDEEISVVKNENWQGDINGETWPDRLDRIEFRVNPDPETSYNSFEAGEGDNANIPPARALDAQETWGTTLDVRIIGSYHYVINGRDPVIGGDENKLLRQAISQAIDRETINEAVYNGMRTNSTGIVPEGIPGWVEGICDYCTYDPEAAQAAFDEWTAAGNEQTEPIRIQFNTGAGHEDVVAIVVENLNAIGIQAEQDPRQTETYFTELAEGDCVICRTGWFADYPTYDNFMYDLFHSDALDGNNYGFVNEEFDALVDQAKQTLDPDEQASLFQQAEDILLNEEIMAVPINWYLGDYAYNQDKVDGFTQTKGGLILWEQISLK